MSDETIRLEVIPADGENEKLYDAIDNASDQNCKTWIEDAEGRRIAAIVPVDVAEEDDRRTAEVLATPVSGPIAAERKALRRRIDDLNVPALADFLGTDPGVLRQWANLLDLAEKGLKAR